MIKCDTCPRFKDYGKMDAYGYHYGICGVTGNIVYPVPHKIKRLSGSGWIKFGIGSCGLYDTMQEALDAMTQIERKRWREKHEGDLQELLTRQTDIQGSGVRADGKEDKDHGNL